MTIAIRIKPLSVNAAWKGKRFKTNEYKDYERMLLPQLPAGLEIPEGKLKISFVFGLSNKCADWDNPVKPLQDILQKKYGFNDSRIYEASVKKLDVKKGMEFIGFSIEAFDGHS